MVWHCGKGNSLWRTLFCQYDCNSDYADSDDNNNFFHFSRIGYTAEIELRDQLEQIAFIDYETGLMSRYKLETVVNDPIEEKKHFSLVFISIDHYYTLRIYNHQNLRKNLSNHFQTD